MSKLYIFRADFVKLIVLNVFQYLLMFEPILPLLDLKLLPINKQVCCDNIKIQIKG